LQQKSKIIFLLDYEKILGRVTAVRRTFAKIQVECIKKNHHKYSKKKRYASHNSKIKKKKKKRARREKYLEWSENAQKTRMKLLQ